jgi:hypothetical protein
MKRYAITGFVIWAGATIALRLFGQFVFRSPIALLAVSLPVLLDTFSSIWFTQMFPNIRADAAGLFGGWLLFCNIVVLLTAVTYAPRRGSGSALTG